MSLGGVFRSTSDNPWLSSLQLSVDWYRINITDAIAAVTASTFVDRCYDTQFNPTLSANNFYCAFFTRNASDGTITHAAETQQNIGAIQTSGIDVQLDWAAQAGPGRLGVNWVVSWLDNWDQQELPKDPFTHRAQTISNSVATAYPEWKWTFNVTYDIGGLGLNARWRYVDGMDDFNEPTFALPAVSYLDAGASYGFGAGALDGLVLRVGVTNVTGKDPQLYPSKIQSNTDPSTYDVLGRRYFVSANYSFK
jgi:iron complex outermembrane receptor protein